MVTVRCQHCFNFYSNESFGEDDETLASIMKCPECGNAPYKPVKQVNKVEKFNQQG